MKRFLSALLALLLLTGCAGNGNTQSEPAAYQQISQQKAKEMMDTQKVVIL